MDMKCKAQYQAHELPKELLVVGLMKIGKNI